MDTFVECLVRRRMTAAVLLKKVFIVLGIFILSVIVFIICMKVAALSFLALVFVAACIYGGRWLFKRQNVEFEYILTNFDLDIDKIMAQQFRKRLTTVNLRNMEMMAPVSPAHAGEYQGPAVHRRIDASTGEAETTWFIRQRDDRSGMTVIFFNPDDRMKAAIRTVAPRKVQDA